MTWITQVGFYLLVTAAVSLGKSHVANVGRRGEPRQDFAYPEVRRNESVIDDYYGTQVKLFKLNDKLYHDFSTFVSGCL